MQKTTLVAACLMTLTLGVHVIAGGSEVHAGLQAVPMSDGLSAFAAILWHAVTVNLAVFSLALFWLAFHPDPALALTISAIQIGFAGLFIWYGLTRLGSVLPMPQWSVFMLVPLLTLWPLRRSKAAVTA